MDIAAVGPFLYVACAGLLCLFLVSTVILVLVMVRRSGRGDGGEHSGDVG